MENLQESEAPQVNDSRIMLEEKSNLEAATITQGPENQPSNLQIGPNNQTEEASINLEDLDIDTLASLSTLIGLNALNTDPTAVEASQDLGASLNIDAETLSNLMNLTALLDTNGANIDLQDPSVLENLSQSLNLENLASLLATPQEHRPSLPATPQDSGPQTRINSSGQQRYSYDSNYKRRGGFPYSNSQRWDDSGRNNRSRNYSQPYQDTMNFDNNPMGHRNFGSNMKTGPYMMRRPYDNSNKFNRRRPYQNFDSMYESSSKRYSENENLLEVPLNELAQGPNSSSNTVVTSFLERGDNPSGYEQKAKDMQEESKNDFSGYYSDKLGLAEQYLNPNETPITKSFHNYMAAANQENNFLKAHIQSCHDSLQKAKRSFFEIQPEFDIDNLDAHLEALLATKKKEGRGSTLKKSICKMTPKKSNPKSKLKKLSRLKEKPLMASFERILGGLDSSLKSNFKSQGSEFVNGKGSNQEITQDLLKKVVKREFEITPELDQLMCMQKILNQESCIYRFPSVQSKSIIYQSSAVLSSGIVVYVHPSSAYLVSQCQRLSQSVTGGYIGNLISREKSTEHLELAKTGQLKVVFTTPEKFITENLADILDISFICLDEAQCVPKLSSNFKANYYNFVRYLRRRPKFIPILAFISPTTREICEDLAKIILASNENIFPNEYLNVGTYDLTISRDEDKLKGLLNLLKSPKFKNRCQSMILYTECKKSTEDLTSFLVTNGYKASAFHAGKNENQKFEMIANIMKNNEGIIVSTSNTDIGIDKAFVNCVIHYTLPKSLEVYIQEVSCLNEQAICHLFLHDEDYFTARLNFRSELVEKYQLKTFIERILDKNYIKKEESRSFTNRRRSSTLDGNYLLNARDEIIGMEMRDERDDIYSVKVSEFCQELDLKKEVVAQIFENFQELDDWIEFCGVTPMACTVKILHGKTAALVPKHKLIQLMVENTRKESGIYQFNVTDMAADLNCATNEIIKTLKNLQNEGSINYEVVEEAFSFKLLFDPNPVKVNAKVEEIYNNMYKKSITNIKKLDLLYAVAKVSSFQTVEHLSKQIIQPYILKNKFDNDKRLKTSYAPIQAIKDVTNLPNQQAPIDRNSDSDKKRGNKINLIEFFEKYLNFKEDGLASYDQIWDNLSSIQDLIPLTRAQTQRERSMITADALPIVIEVFEEMNSLENNIQQEERVWDENLLKAKLTRSTGKIMQGLTLFSSKKDWKTHKSWQKYYKNDSWDLYEVIAEVVGNFINAKEYKKAK